MPIQHEEYSDYKDPIYKTEERNIFEMENKKMDKFVVRVYQDHKNLMIAIFFLIESVVLLIKYCSEGVEFWNLMGTLVFFIIFVDLIYNGSYLLIGKIKKESEVSEYYIRFVYIFVIYLFSLCCVIS